LGPNKEPKWPRDRNEHEWVEKFGHKWGKKQGWGGNKGGKERGD